LIYPHRLAGVPGGISPSEGDAVDKRDRAGPLTGNMEPAYGETVFH
jgi:hypothetical protein